MNKIIEAQLKNCIYANLSNFDSATNTYHIPKYSKPQYNIGKCYLVKLNSAVVNNTTSVLATNWNHGTAPRAQYLIIYISSFMGTMAKVDSREYDFDHKTSLDTVWSGWLNLNEIDQLAVIN